MVVPAIVRSFVRHHPRLLHAPSMFVTPNQWFIVNLSYSNSLLPSTSCKLPKLRALLPLHLHLACSRFVILMGMLADALAKV